MKVLLEGLFVALVLVLELVGVVVLGRSTLITETYPPTGGRATTTTYIVTSDDDNGGAYWVEWEDPSCGGWEVPREGDTENFEVNRSKSEVVGIGEAAGCRGHLWPHAATMRQPGVRPTGGHQAGPTSENAPSTHSGE
jgi:hypothetical protein